MCSTRHKTLSADFFLSLLTDQRRETIAVRIQSLASNALKVKGLLHFWYGCQARRCLCSAETLCMTPTPTSYRHMGEKGADPEQARDKQRTWAELQWVLEFHIPIPALDLHCKDPQPGNNLHRNNGWPWPEWYYPDRLGVFNLLTATSDPSELNLLPSVHPQSPRLYSLVEL